MFTNNADMSKLDFVQRKGEWGHTVVSGCSINLCPWLSEGGLALL